MMLAEPAPGGPALLSATRPASGQQAHREGVALLAYSEAKRKHYMVVRPAYSAKAQLIRIDPESGVLKWDQAVGRDTFEGEAAALAFLQGQGKVEVLAHGKALLGYTVLGPVALLLLVEAVRVSAVLPGGHQIKTVTQSRWHRISLQQPELDATSQAAAKAELDRGIDKATSFPVDGAHYYCETLDMSRPFPSARPAAEPSWPFVWNKALTAPLRLAGLDGPNSVAPALLQGMAESRELEDFDGCRFSYCLISRRCRLHVGPRYKARGLNDAADPGNEIECDQLVWKHAAAPGKPLAWSRYTWRRGSVPLWWSVTIRNGGMGEAEIKIRTTNTFRGSRRYVRRLQQRYTPSPALEPPADEAGGCSVPAAAADARARSLEVPVVFFSLLRKGTPDRDRSEAKLADAFDYLAGQLRSLHKLPVRYVALDWHQMDKELGSEALVEAFWTQLSALLPPQGFALGTMSKVGPDHSDTHDGLELGEPAVPRSAGGSSDGSGGGSGSGGACGQGYSPVGAGWHARWFRQQQGVTRYNCADSLDRTNVGSFFGAVQVFVEQCRELDIAIAATSAAAATMARQALLRRQAAATAAAALDAGGAGTPAGSARPPLAGGPSAGSLAAAAQDKRPATAGSGSGSSGFLSSLGKDLSRGLGTVMVGMGVAPELRASPKASPTPTPRDLGRELRSASSPNISALAREQPAAQQAAAAAGSPQQQQAQQAGQQGLQQQPQQQQAEQLPPGWESKWDAVNKRHFYVDHNTKTTTWNRPCWPPLGAGQAGSTAGGSSGGSSGGGAGQQAQAQQQGAAVLAPHERHRARISSRAVGEEASGSDSDTPAERERFEPLTPWCMFSPRNATVRHFARAINPAALSAIAELFLMNGDMCAWLYTGSPAMHSEKITLFEPESSRLKKAGAGTYGNSFIAIRRRYNNVLMDEERKMQADIFLGLKSRTYFPTLHLAYREPEGAALDTDAPESDDDVLHGPDGADAASSSGGGGGNGPDPLGLLTWPLESSKAVSRGASSSLLALGQGVGSSAVAAAAAAAGAGLGGLLGAAQLARGSKSAERQRASTSNLGAPEDAASELLHLDAARGAGHARSFSSDKIRADFQALQRAGGGGSPAPQPAAAAAAAATAVAAAARPAAEGRSLAEFDSELPDGAPLPPPGDGGLKPFADPLGLL